jgi:hypothetical protein
MAAKYGSDACQRLDLLTRQEQDENRTGTRKNY